MAGKDTHESRTRINLLLADFRAAVAQAGPNWPNEEVTVTANIWGHVVATLDELEKRVVALEDTQAKP